MTNGRWYKLGQPVESGGCTCVFLYLYFQVLSNGRWYKLGQPVESGGWCRSSRSGDLAVWEIQMCLTDNLLNISLVTSSLLGKRKMIMWPFHVWQWSGIALEMKLFSRYIRGLSAGHISHSLGSPKYIAIYGICSADFIVMHCTAEKKGNGSNNLHMN